MIDIEGYELWNISRGLTRNQNEYKHHLALAAEPYMGSYGEGRGKLRL